MSEPGTQDPQSEQSAPEAEPSSPTPPWGDDFDPARAWDKIQKANSEAKNLREKLQAASRSQMTDEQRQQLDEYARLVEASKTDQQRKDEALEAAARERDDYRTEALRLRVALKHGISADDFDLLGSGDEEQIEVRAQRIAEKNKAVQDAMAALNTAPPGAPPSRRPGEQLKPGATPPSVPQLADQDYPAEWLSPTQRARVQQAREQYQ
jgi:hypothetical protein